MMMAIAKLSSEKKPVGLGQVSQHAGISRRYLEQLATPLKNASLLRAVSGRDGGYVLNRPASEIKLGDIIVAAIGKIAVTECAVESGGCIHSEFCNCKALWTLINHRITDVLDDYSLADILDESWPGRVETELRRLH
jgi:Rrf2 family protein